MDQTPTSSDAPPAEPKFSVSLSSGFTEWLAGQNACLAVTTYQVGKVIFLGVSADGALWTYNRNIGRCLGLAADRDGLWVTSDFQLHRFANLLRAGETGPQDCDAVYAPRFSYFTGDLDIHDVGIEASGQPVFVNTLFNCLARPSPNASFEPIWAPSFISGLKPGDRCHLNGLAMKEGAAAFVSATSQSDTFDGWRADRRDGGVILDVGTKEVLAWGLSMPHSPRWHGGRLWLLNSGTGQFGWLEPASGRFEEIAFCPGFARGLSFLGNYAVVGFSMARENKTFSGLALDDELARRNASAQCGLHVIDLSSGEVVHTVRIDGIVREIYDVAFIPGIRKPSMVSLDGTDTKRTLKLPDSLAG